MQQRPVGQPSLCDVWWRRKLNHKEHMNSGCWVSQCLLLPGNQTFLFVFELEFLKKCQCLLHLTTDFFSFALGASGACRGTMHRHSSLAPPPPLVHQSEIRTSPVPHSGGAPAHDSVCACTLLLNSSTEVAPGRHRHTCTSTPLLTPHMHVP